MAPINLGKFIQHGCCVPQLFYVIFTSGKSRMFTNMKPDMALINETLAQRDIRRDWQSYRYFSN